MKLIFESNIRHKLDLVKQVFPGRWQEEVP